MGNGEWGVGTGDWGLGTGEWGLGTGGDEEAESNKESLLYSFAPLCVCLFSIPSSQYPVPNLKNFPPS
ncbi:hypothetical protein [Nostoc sp.]|uniref:hypothetical protein n=1 Tax=Nostoc sp. TaxID=1180 RepID=UPI002FF99DD9